MKRTSSAASRRPFVRQFYAGNHLAFIAAALATILMILANLLISWLLQQVLDAAGGSNDALPLPVLAAITVALLAGFLLVGLLQYLSRPRFLAKAMRQYKDYAFRQITKKGITAFQQENSAVYLSALSNDAATIESSYLNASFSLISLSVSFVGAFAMMLWYSPQLTLTAVLLSLLPVAVSALAGGRLVEAEKNVSVENAGYVSTLKDCLGGFSVVKSFKAERQISGLLASSNARAEDAKEKKKKLDTLIQYAAQTAGATAQLGVFLAGAWLALSGRGITAGVVIVFVNLMNFVIQPIAELPGLLAGRRAALALIDKLAEAVGENVRDSGKSIPPQLQSGITLNHVRFGYDADKEILHDINLHFESGKSYAIVGGSGSGKSTLLNLLMAAHTDYTGEICYDNHELRDINTGSLYDLVSLIQQHVFVFNSTIADNITMFADFPQEELDRAVAMSGLSALMASKGPDYLCGENGSGLSGGEKQRISIARSLLRKTPVLFVDEATAALDPQTAYHVSGSILDLSGLTRIVVTHSLDETLLRRYDGIVTLRNGSVAETGSFEDLMEKKGYFYSLFTVSQ